MMKKIICVSICVIIAFAFASCKKGATKGVITDSGGVTGQTQSSDVSAVSSAQSTTEEKKDEKETTKESTTTPMPSTKAEEAIPISKDEALERLSEFYGSAYKVKEAEKKGDIQHYKVFDNAGNLYAKLEVNLKNSDVKETIEHSGEINQFNLLV